MAETPVAQHSAEELVGLLSSFRLVDLSVVTAEELPGTWPTVTPYHAMTICEYTDWRGPVFTRLLSIEEHVGTHCDAPAHFIPHPDTGLPHATKEGGGVTVEQLDLNQFVGPAAVIDATHLTDTGEPGLSPIITVDDIKSWEAEHGVLEPTDVVLLRTDWTDRHYRKAPEGNMFAYNPIIAKSSPAWPAPDAETMEYLVEARGVRCVGIDNNSMGPLQADAEPHWAGLGRGAVFVERLTKLRELPPRGAFFMFLPIKIDGGSGAPGRAIAFVPGAG
jgi:kynurenine formamidase